jgi:hypothetical protein
MLNFIYVKNNKICTSEKTNIDFNDYIKFNEIKHISYNRYDISILTIYNTIVIFIMKLMVNTKYTYDIQYYYDEINDKIRFIFMTRHNRILIVRNSNKLDILSYFNNEYILYSNIFGEYISNIRKINEYDNSYLILTGTNDTNELWILRYVNIPVTEWNQKYISNNISNNSNYKLFKIDFKICIKNIYSSYDVIIIQSKKNELYGIGNNLLNKLGMGLSVQHTYDPLLIPIDLKDRIIKNICCQSLYTSVLLDSDDMYIIGKGKNQSSLDGIKILKNTDIYYIWKGYHNTLVLKYDRTLEYLGYSDLYIKDDNLTYVTDRIVNIFWTPSNHYKFSQIIKHNIILLFTILKYNYNTFFLKIPKPVIYIIIQIICN